MKPANVISLKTLVIILLSSSSLCLMWSYDINCWLRMPLMFPCVVWHWWVVPCGLCVKVGGQTLFRSLAIVCQYKHLCMWCVCTACVCHGVFCFIHRLGCSSARAEKRWWNHWWFWKSNERLGKLLFRVTLLQWNLCNVNSLKQSV